MISVIESIRKFIPPVHREGYPFIAISFVASLVLLLVWEPLGWFGFLTTIYIAYFFRDPIRITPMAPNLVVSPADGLITAVDMATPPPELGLGREKRARISVFLSVFDVHVNRTPVAGSVTRISYRPGKFLNADLDKASEDNERNSLIVKSGEHEVAVVQIAGLIARRIVCWAREGDTLSPGQRFGLIRFGSRLDVYLPKGAVTMAAVCQTAIGGETVIADLSGKAERLSYRSD